MPSQMQNDAGRHTACEEADADVDSLHCPTNARHRKQVSTVDTTMTLLAVPWALCTASFVAVILYVNVHCFSIYDTLQAAQVRGFAADISLAHRDTARYVLLAVSLMTLVVHVGVSYLLFRHAYLITRSVSASLGDLSVMVELICTLNCGTFFFVDSVQRARSAGGCGRYWMMAFSPFAEIRASEAALNAVSLRMAALPHNGDDDADAVAAASALPSPQQNSPSTHAGGSTQASPVTCARYGGLGSSGDGVLASLGDSPLLRHAGPRQPTPNLERSVRQLAASLPSLSMSADAAASVGPFRMTLRRRHAALLQISLLSYRQLVQGDAAAVAPIATKFLSAVLLSVRRFQAHVVELYADSAILSWNGFESCAGSYVQTCAQCGYWLYDHLLHHINEESGAFFSLAGYAGHVVCGSTSEGSHVLHGAAVAVLRELPSLLERRYCRYVWLGDPPPPVVREDVACVQWGTVIADGDVTLGLYVMGDPPDDPGWYDELRQPRVWHAPQWKLFGDEDACVQSAASPGTCAGERAVLLDPPQTRAAAELRLSTSITGGGLCPLETFHDRNNVRYQLSNTVLGESKSCVVRLAVSSSGTLVAVKEIKIERGEVNPMRRRRHQREKRIVVSPGDQLALMSEVRIMEKLHHTCIVSYISFQETHDRLRVVMEYVGGGNLLQFVKQHLKSGGGRAPMAVLLRSVLEGIAFLHRHDILHGDIKPQNVLVPDSGPCKLADFGISRRVSDDSAHPIEGTPFYMAPEATRGASCLASDIWSFGIMMAEVMTGRLPYEPGITDSYLIAQFMFGSDVERRLSTPLEPAADAVFMACTQYDPTARKTASELLQMPFFASKAAAAVGDTP